MKISKYKAPKNVLIFNGARTLIAITRSLNSAAQLTGNNLQAISFSCTGKHISTGGFYFRHIDSNIEITLSDLNTLSLEEYDTLCGVERRYHSVKDMARRRKIIETKKAMQKGKERDKDQENSI